MSTVDNTMNTLPSGADYTPYSGSAFKQTNPGGHRAAAKWTEHRVPDGYFPNLLTACGLWLERGGYALPGAGRQGATRRCKRCFPDAPAEAATERLPGRLRFYAGSGNAPEYLRSLDTAKAAAEIDYLRRKRRELAADLEISRLLCGRLADALEACRNRLLDISAGHGQTPQFNAHEVRLATEALGKAGRS